MAGSWSHSSETGRPDAGWTRAVGLVRSHCPSERTADASARRICRPLGASKSAANFRVEGVTYCRHRGVRDCVRPAHQPESALAARLGLLSARSGPSWGFAACAISADRCAPVAVIEGCMLAIASVPERCEGGGAVSGNGCSGMSCQGPSIGVAAGRERAGRGARSGMWDSMGISAGSAGRVRRGE